MSSGLGVVRSLVHLVTNSVLGGRSTGSDRCVGVLGDALVGLLAGLSTGALDGLGDGVGSVLFGGLATVLPVQWSG